jgi:hypothetical protein
MLSNSLEFHRHTAVGKCPLLLLVVVSIITSTYEHHYMYNVCTCFSNLLPSEALKPPFVTRHTLTQVSFIADQRVESSCAPHETLRPRQHDTNERSAGARRKEVRAAFTSRHGVERTGQRADCQNQSNPEEGAGPATSRGEVSASSVQ